MYEMDREKFGTFIQQLRKELNLTQKEVAQRLMISDKAVSKWERGLSMPDITLLMPLGEVLGVTVTELLQGERVAKNKQMDVDEVEALVSKTIGLSAYERQKKLKPRKFWIIMFLISLAVVAAEIFILWKIGFSRSLLTENLLLVELLSLVFAVCFCFTMDEVLPSYYDENRISHYSDGIFQMHIPGVHFNNSNWPYILRTGRMWMIGTAVCYPLVFGLLYWSLGVETWQFVQLPVILIASVDFFLPMIITAKRHEG